MFNRTVIFLKALCLGLSALFLFELARFATRKDPGKDLRLNPLPDFLAEKAPKPPAKSSAATNSVPDQPGLTKTNVSVAPPVGTNAALATNSVSTNAAAVAAKTPAATNGLASTNANLAANKVVPAAKPPMGPHGGPPNAAPAADLPPAVKARVDQIVQSEILAPIMRPLPMALLGIGGKDVFFRAPNGQTGLLREGEELGGVKLLRIGTNRVLVEHEHQTNELTLFSGLGGETLLPQRNEKPQ